MLEMEKSDNVKGQEFNSRFELYTDSGPNMVFIGLSREATPELRVRDYNLILMHDAGLVVFEKELKGGEFRGGYIRLSNAGHDALDAIRDNSVWNSIIEASPREAYSIIKNLTSSVGATALASVFGLG